MKKIQKELGDFEGKYVHLDKTKNAVISDLKTNYDDVYEKLEKNGNEIIELQDFLKKTEMLNNEQMNNFSMIEKNHELKINEMNDNFEAEIDELKTLLNDENNVIIDQKRIQIFSIEKELNESKEKLNNAEIKIHEMQEDIMNDSIPLQEELKLKYENQIIELEYVINEINEKNLLYDVLVTDFENLEIEKIQFIDVIGKYESDLGLLKTAYHEKEKLLQTSSSEIRDLNDNMDNQNRIIKDVNDKLNINISEIQDRIIENVSLREDIKNVNLQVTVMQY
jgi:chromosome segregation ATPase